MFPNWNGIGINLSTAATYYFWDGHWRKVGQGTTVKDDDIVPPDRPFWVRHNISSSTYFYARGVALVGKWRVQVRRQPDIKQDNWLAIPRFTTQTLAQSGLISSGAFRASPSPSSRLDELLVFDNTAIAKNKSASATYYYWSGAWRKVGAGSTDLANDPVFTPGTGVILRAGTGTSTFWVNENDTDADGLPDLWEIQKFADLSQSGAGDWDGDGVTNFQEYQNNLEPKLGDSDGDGLVDYSFDVSITQPSSIGNLP